MTKAVGFISITVFGHWMQIESMIHEWQPNSRHREAFGGTQRTKEIWLQNTHKVDRTGEWCDRRRKEQGKVDDKEIEER